MYSHPQLPNETEELVNFLNNRDNKTWLRKAIQQRRKAKKYSHLKFPNFALNHYHQYDVLYITHDGGYKYILSVVDVGTGACGLRPLKNMAQNDILTALDSIYTEEDQPLRYPDRIKTDKARHFGWARGDSVSTRSRWGRWLINHSIIHKFYYKNRKQTVLPVESLNRIVSRAIYYIQYRYEQRSDWNFQYKKWVHLLPTIQKTINQNRDTTTPPNIPKDFVKNKKAPDDIIPINTQVYKFLEAPTDPVSGKTLPGKFRSTDIRLEKNPRTIKNIQFLDGQSVVSYELSGDDVNRMLFTYPADFMLASSVEI